jgi:hypothetical protein
MSQQQLTDKEQEELIKHIATIKDVIPNQSLYKIDYEVLKTIEKTQGLSHKI